MILLQKLIGALTTKTRYLQVVTWGATCLVQPVLNLIGEMQPQPRAGTIYSVINCL